MSEGQFLKMRLPMSAKRKFFCLLFHWERLRINDVICILRKSLDILCIKIEDQNIKKIDNH